MKIVIEVLDGIVRADIDGIPGIPNGRIEKGLGLDTAELDAAMYMLDRVRVQIRTHQLVRDDIPVIDVPIGVIPTLPTDCLLMQAALEESEPLDREV